MSPNLTEKTIDSSPEPSADLAATRRERGSAGARVFLSNLPTDPTLRSYADEYTTRAGRDIEHLDAIIGELERREAHSSRLGSDLLGLCVRAKDNADVFTFEERRSALAALGFRAHANDDDPARRR